MSAALAVAPSKGGLLDFKLATALGEEAAQALEAKFVDLVFSSEVDWLAPLQSKRAEEPTEPHAKAA